MFRWALWAVILFSGFAHSLMAQTELESSQGQVQAKDPAGQVHDISNMNMHGMPGMDHSMHMGPEGFIGSIMHHASSGTSAEPESTPQAMLMRTFSGWMLMLHGSAFVTYQQQSGLRGADKTFSTNWIMPMAQHGVGKGKLTLRGMLSLEPATITNRYYPELFQVGETARGMAIVDGQHPHDFFMEIAALYDLPIGKRSLLSVYAAPLGDPAIGPTAYPHRSSAMEDPLATLGHHQEDSTHIASDVVTVGFTHRSVRVEASGFHGREPDESRWDIDQGALDSWSFRVTANPAKNWSGQYSYGRIHSPEQLMPNDDQERMTASVMYNKPFSHGNWSNSLIWGRTRSLQEGFVYNSYLAESLLHFAGKNNFWSRIETSDRTSDLLLSPQTSPAANFIEAPIGRVQAYSFGYDRELNVLPHLSAAPGVQLTLYSTPLSLQGLYGQHPVGVAMFLRFRIRGKQD